MVNEICNQDMQFFMINGEKYYLVSEKYFTNDFFKEETDKQEARKALNILTIAEQEVAQLIFADKNTKRFTLNCSDIANKLNYSKSVVSIAINKLKSSGIVDSYSRGARGTEVRVLNNQFKGLIDKLEL